MINPTGYFVAGVAPISIRWETEGGFFRETRAPGAVLADLPQDLRAQIDDHWTPELVSAHAAQVAAAVAEIVEPPPMPVLTPRQMRLMMLQIGLEESQIVAMIEAIADHEARAAAQIEWTWATGYDRDHPLVALLAAALEFSAGELDDLWRYAATI